MNKPKEKFFTRRKIVFLLFFVFLSLRLFVNYSSSLYGADNVKYFELAKNFPYHTFYNNQLYLLHPPLFSYIIHFFTLIFQEDHIAAIFISLVSSITTFFIVYHLFMLITKNFNVTFFVLLFFTLSNGLIRASHAPAKESFLMMLLFLTLYFYIKGLKLKNAKHLAFATISGSALALTADHFALLIPALGLSYIFWNSEKIDLMKFKFPSLKYAVIPIVVMMLFYGSWTLIKFVQYSSYDYYPNGEEGTPVNTHNLGLIQLFNPELFEDIGGPYIKPGIASVAKKLAFNFGYMLNIEPFSIPKGLNFTTMNLFLLPRHIAYMLLIYLPLAIISIFGFFLIVKDIIRTRQIHNNFNLFIVLLFLIFLFPLTQKYVSPRYIYTSYFFLFYFTSYGIISLLNKRLRHSILQKIIPVIVILLLLIIPFWYYFNPHLVLLNKKLVSAQNTADFINDNFNKEDAIMAQPGYAAKLIYLTGHRTVGLYPNPEKLKELIDFYNIDYIVFGKYYTDVFKYTPRTVDYIRKNPDKFELIATIPEDYSNFYAEGNLARTDEVYIYKVKNAINS